MVEIIALNKYMFKKDTVRNIKYIVIGDSCVGKSSLADCYINRTYAIGESSSTIGVSYLYKRMNYGDVKLKLQIWDTAGQEKFRAITNSYYRNASGAFICFNMADRESFENLKRFMEDYITHTNDCIALLVATHKDLASQRVVTREEAEEYAMKHGLKYIEISSKTGENVDLCFNMMTQLVCEQMNEEDFDSDNETVRLLDGEQYWNYVPGCCQ